MTGMPKLAQTSKSPTKKTSPGTASFSQYDLKFVCLTGFQGVVITLLYVLTWWNTYPVVAQTLILGTALLEVLLFITYFSTRIYPFWFRQIHFLINLGLFGALFFMHYALLSPWMYWMLTIPAAALFLGTRKELFAWTAATLLSGIAVYLVYVPGFLEAPSEEAFPLLSEKYLLFALVFYFILLIGLREFLENTLVTHLETELKKAARENKSLKRQFLALDNRNFRLVKLYQNLKKFETSSEQRTEIITEAAIALSSKNKEIQGVVDRFMTQSKKLEEINEDLTNSIRYAQRIQAAITPDSEMVIGKFRDAFIYYQPRDIVSGDFYWYTERKYLEGMMKILIVADCTGHGVPGAFMTIMGNSLINEIVNEMKVVTPDSLLQELDRKIIETLSSRNGQAIHDGMDMVVLMIDDRQKLIHYAAAHNPLYYVRKQKIHQIKGSKFAVGSSQYKTRKVFIQHTIQAEPGDVFYVFTDGFQDQFGEKEKRKYMTRRFRNFLLTINRMPLQMQGEKVKSEFEHWKGNFPQTDDVLVIGFRM